MSAETENLLRASFLMTLVTTLLITLGAVFADLQGMWAALAGATVLNAGLWVLSDRIVLASVGARELGPREEPELRELVAELAALMHLPVPRIHLVATPSPNALATGRDPEHASIVVTRGLLARLPRDEVRAVLAYELGHIAERDTLPRSVASALAAMILLPARLAGWRVTFSQPYAPMRRTSRAGSLLAALLAPPAALLLRLSLEDDSEYAADALAARAMGSGRALCRALIRLEREAYRSPTPFEPSTSSLFVVNPLGRPGGAAALFRTHPSTRARVRRLEMMGMAAIQAHFPLLLTVGGGDVETRPRGR